MKLGFYSAALPQYNLEQTLKFAQEHHFDAVEVACWPRTVSDRRYAGVTTLDVASLAQDQARDIRANLSRAGVSISALSYYPNPLSPDLEYRAAVLAHLHRVILAAEMLEIPVVGTFVGKDKVRSLDYNLTAFAQTWPGLVHFARDHHVSIAIENCPMIFAPEELPGGCNLASTPAIWQRLFEIIPDDNFGLNFDPSHLMFQMIDPYRAAAEFAGRILHVHAKDIHIDSDSLYQNGILSSAMTWQAPRLPGRGDIDWARLLKVLRQSGYDKTISIEHEDTDFEGSEDRIISGFLHARDFLHPLIS